MAEGRTRRAGPGPKGDPPVGEIATVTVCNGDEATLELLCEHLTADCFEALPASTGADALRICRFNNPDFLIVDLDLPDMPGVDLIKQIRDADEGTDSRIDPNLAIIALTRRDAVIDRLRAIELGADEYVPKPFSYEELTARIESVRRRRHSRQDRPTRVGDLLIDPARRKVTVGDREVRLAKKEFVLLRVLASDPTRVFSKDELLRDVWGFKAPANRTRTIDSHASRLRRKLDPEELQYVVNTWGVGYRLVKS